MAEQYINTYVPDVFGFDSETPYGSTVSKDLTVKTSAGTINVNGASTTVGAIEHVYTASKDTYDDINADGTYTHTEVANNAAPPSQVVGTTRLQKVVTDSTKVVSVTKVAKTDWDNLQFVTGRGLQSRELNEMSSINDNYLARLSDTIFKEGDRVEGCQVRISGSSLTVTEGLVYVKGKIRHVPFTSLTVDTSGTVSVGLSVTSSTIKEDTSLRDPATGYDGSGLPGAWRGVVSVSWGVVSDTNPGILPVFVINDGQLQSIENPPTIYSRIEDQLLSRRTFDESGHYKVHGFNITLVDEGVPDSLTLRVTPGLAYVLGKEVRVLGAQSLAWRRPIDTRTVVSEITEFSPTSLDTTSIVRLARMPVASVSSMSAIVRTPCMQVVRGSGTNDYLPTQSTVAAKSGQFGETKNGQSGVQYSTLPAGTQADLLLFSSAQDQPTDSSTGISPTWVLTTDYTRGSGDSIVWGAGKGPASGTAYYAFWNYSTANGQSGAQLTKGTRVLKTATAEIAAYSSANWIDDNDGTIQFVISSTNKEVQNVSKVYTQKGDTGNPPNQSFTEGADWTWKPGATDVSNNVAARVVFLNPDVSYAHPGAGVKFRIDYSYWDSSTGLYDTSDGVGEYLDISSYLEIDNTNGNITFTSDTSNKYKIAYQKVEPRFRNSVDFRPAFDANSSAVTKRAPARKIHSQASPSRSYVWNFGAKGENAYQQADMIAWRNAGDGVGRRSLGSTERTASLLNYHVDSPYNAAYWNYTKANYDTAGMSRSSTHLKLSRFGLGVGKDSGSSPAVLTATSGTWPPTKPWKLVDGRFIPQVGSQVVESVTLWLRFDVSAGGNKSNGAGGTTNCVRSDVLVTDLHFSGAIGGVEWASGNLIDYSVSYTNPSDANANTVARSGSPIIGSALPLNMTTPAPTDQEDRNTGADNSPTYAINNFWLPVTWDPSKDPVFRDQFLTPWNGNPSIFLADDLAVNIQVSLDPSVTMSTSSEYTFRLYGAVPVLNTMSFDDASYGTFVTSSYDYYVPRYDAVALQSDGRVKVVGGDATSKPTVPAVSGEELSLGVIIGAPDTRNPNIQEFTTKRTTMRGIQAIRERVRNLEENVASLLSEREQVDSEGVAAQGALVRGTLIDNFEDFRMSATTYTQHLEYKQPIVSGAGASKNVANYSQVAVPPERVPLDGNTATNGIKMYKVGDVVRPTSGSAAVPNDTQQFNDSYFIAVTTGQPSATASASMSWNISDYALTVDGGVTWRRIDKYDYLNNNSGIDISERVLSLPQNPDESFSSTPSYIDQSSSSGVKFGKELITLNHGDISSRPWCIQRYATNWELVNPYSTFEPVCDVSINPTGDHWVDTASQPAVHAMLDGTSTYNFTLTHGRHHPGGEVDENTPGAFYDPRSGIWYTPLPSPVFLGRLPNWYRQIQVGTPVMWADTPVQFAPGVNTIVTNSGNVAVSGDTDPVWSAHDIEVTGIGFLPLNISVHSVTDTEYLGESVVRTDIIPIMRTKNDRGDAIVVTATGKLWSPSTEVTAKFGGKPVYLSPVSPTVAGLTAGSVVPDNLGTWTAELNIPDNIPTGIAQVEFFDDNSNSGSVPFVSQGQVNIVESKYVSVTNYVYEVTGAMCPVAQSFIPDTSGYLSNIKVWFAKKPTDSSNTAKYRGVKLEVRTMVNGYPGETILGESTTHSTSPANVSVSDNAAPGSSTQFDLSDLVYVEKDQEYCFVIKDDVDEYALWVAKLGEVDKYYPSGNGGAPVVSQNSLGVFFKSANNSTWTAEQRTDMKYEISIADFNSVGGRTGTLKFSPMDGLNASMFLLDSTQHTPPNTKIQWSYSVDGGSNYIEVTPGAASSLSRVGQKVDLKAILSTDSDLLSPAIQKDSIVANGFSYTGELDPMDPNYVISDYITTPIDIEDGLGDFNSLRVLSDEWIPTSSSIEYYFSSNNGATWTKMPSSKSEAKDIYDSWLGSYGASRSITPAIDYSAKVLGNAGIIEVVRDQTLFGAKDPSVSNWAAGSTATSGGTITNGTYTICYTRLTPNGESAPSEISQVITTTGSNASVITLTNASYTLLNSGATGESTDAYAINVYISLSNPKPAGAHTSATDGKNYVLVKTITDFDTSSANIPITGTHTITALPSVTESKYLGGSNTTLTPRKFRFRARLRSKIQSYAIENPTNAPMSAVSDTASNLSATTYYFKYALSYTYTNPLGQLVEGITAVSEPRTFAATASKSVELSLNTGKKLPKEVGSQSDLTNQAGSTTDKFFSSKAKKAYFYVSTSLTGIYNLVHDSSQGSFTPRFIDNTSTSGSASITISAANDLAAPASVDVTNYAQAVNTTAAMSPYTPKISRLRAIINKR